MNKDMPIIVPCPNCGMYLVKPLDRYCGYCGKPLAILEIDNGAIQVDLPVGQKSLHTHTLRVRNAGITDLSLTLIDPPDASVIYVREPHQFDLHPYDEPVDIDVHVDCGELAKKELKVCSLPFESTDPQRRSGEIYFCIPEPGSVEIKEKDTLNLKNIELAVRQQLSVHVTNKGGQAVRLSIVTDQDSPLRLVFCNGDTFWIRGYQQEVELPLEVWSVTEGRYKDEIQQLQCTHVGPQERQSMVTIRLSAICVKGPIPDVEDIDFGQLVPGQVKLWPLVIRNKGGVPFTINEVELDQHGLIHILTNMPVEVKPGLTGSTIEVHLSTRKLSKVAGTVSGQLILKTDIKRQPDVVVRWKAELFVPQLDQNLVLAVDFGTVYSCAAVYGGEHYGPPEIVREDNDHDGLIPSMLVFVPGPEEVFLVGKDAEAKAPQHLKGVVRNLKRCFEKEEWTIYDRKYTSVDLASLIIEQMILEAMCRYHKRPLHVAMTIPAAYWGFKRNAMEASCRQACKQADVDDEPRLIDEPTAVAMHYLNSNSDEVVYQSDKPIRILVFDFGGGTLDISIVEVKLAGGKLEIHPIIARGDNFMGGIDIDVALLQGMAEEASKVFPQMDKEAIVKLKDEFERKYGKKDDVLPAFQESRSHWCEQSRLTKEQLSKEPSVKFRVDYLLDKEGKRILRDNEAAPFEENVLLSKFGELIQNRVDRACQIVVKTLIHVGLQREDIQIVLMTGQSSKIKKFHDAIEELFPRVSMPREDKCPLKTSVACGAAIIAYRQMYTDDTIFVVKNLNRTSYRYGIDLPKNVAERQFIKLIEIGESYDSAHGVYKHRFSEKHGFIVEVAQDGTGDNTYKENQDIDISCVGTINLKSFPASEAAIGIGFPGGKLVVTVNETPVKLGPAKSKKGVYI